MAKKRVHELAKQYDMPSSEVMKLLTAAGITVKVAASAVDEEAADRALTGKPQLPASNGTKKAPEAAAPRPGQPIGPLGRGPLPPPPPAKPAKPAKDEAPRRPTRSSLQGERAPGVQGGVRRVVIDSQAARRPGGPGGGPGGPGRPGGGPGGPAPGQQRRARGRGRRRARRQLYEAQQEAAAAAGPAPERAPDTVRVNSGSTVKDVAEYLRVPVPEIIKKLMGLGEMATLTKTLSDDALQLLAEEFDKKIEIVHAADDAPADPVFEDADEDLEFRPPVVTIMGHVDHGKTSLLDAIRHTDVTAGEAGGITQHIGAYQVHHNDKVISFLDTPGHEAFTAMRARGAQVTDIAVIVVAADDGVKPQTREAVDHARAADVPILVAVNKVDKEGAQPDRVRTEMTQLGLQPEEWGGDVMFVDVSAKTRQGLDDLLEGLLLTAEVEEIRSNPNASASGVVIESKLDPGRGAVVTVLVQRGTMKVGDALAAGSHWGRVRAMHDYLGRKVKQALPSEPVELLGFDTVPEAGEFVQVVENDRKARDMARDRSNRLKTEAMARRSARARVSLTTIFDEQRDQAIKQLNLILKADVSGSLEAFEDEIARLPQSEVQVDIISSGVGGITESDVNLAAASDAIIMGFNVRPVGEARLVAEREDVEIRSYAIIYKAIDELRDAMQGMLAPEEVEETVGNVEVRAIFKASKVGTIAGSYVTDGRVTRGARVRLVRDGTIVWEGQIDSLKRFNEDTREVAAGYECGIVLKDYQDVKEGDQLEVFETRQVERTLG
ncbi:MAG: Translation initiation factor 2 [uncultured Solirubrobacteraceae bacterium]|uniref:Translation initiation factor IF-2 n=1 Tax=uncultured Solirubrobacteraceae bacterium TaxID=1162706 RepID=A0A6J4SZ98_9ACTN|nr:MAG: Translation initiation factor 2 [uncultured Solirubrobacteraceae bacterium]